MIGDPVAGLLYCLRFNLLSPLFSKQSLTVSRPVWLFGTSQSGLERYECFCECRRGEICAKRPYQGQCKFCHNKCKHNKQQQQTLKFLKGTRVCNVSWICIQNWTKREFCDENPAFFDSLQDLIPKATSSNSCISVKLEIGTVALVCVYFKKLYLHCRVNKLNHQLPFAACLLIA